ncbi:hypothetical protein Bbelb_159390 [Branchiostoma belcheri]|nr:hypothetical protein Bbelb_159390 [Branchiostoma belcheri]
MAAEGNWTTAKPVHSTVTGTYMYLPVNTTEPAFVSEATLYEESSMLSPSNGIMTTTPNSMPDTTAQSTTLQCPNLARPAKGSMTTGSNAYRDVVHFTCNKGYKLVGPSSLTCLSDGTWSGRSPTCRVGERTVWMGLREKYTGWFWVDGSRLTYENWYRDEPDNESFMEFFDKDVNCAGLYTKGRSGVVAPHSHVTRTVAQGVRVWSAREVWP